MPVVKRRDKPRERVGQFREVATLERPADLAPSDYGERVPSYVKAGDWPCHMEMLNAREAENARQLYADATIRLTGRYVPGVTTQWRVVIRGVPYEIGIVDNVEMRNRDTVLTVSGPQA